MPGLRADVVGAATDPIDHVVDGRWIMAHAASLGLDDDAHLDPDRPAGLIAHPMLTAGLEWPAVLRSNTLPGRAEMPRSEIQRGVHAAHDVTLHRPIVEGDRLATRGMIGSVRRRTAGAEQVLELVTVDESGARVVTTRMTSIFLGVDVVGDDRDELAEPPDDHLDEDEDLEQIAALSIDRFAALRYTEGARIWNPIHTDARVARAAGLAAPILHGTATLALAVSAVAARAGRSAADVQRIRCRFGAMVTMPSAVTVDGTVDDGGARFEVVSEDGGRAIRRGQLSWHPPEDRGP